MWITQRCPLPNSENWALWSLQSAWTTGTVEAARAAGCSFITCSPSTCHKLLSLLKKGSDRRRRTDHQSSERVHDGDPDLHGAWVWGWGIALEFPGGTERGFAMGGGVERRWGPVRLSAEGRHSRFGVGRAVVRSGQTLVLFGLGF
jgi:hypothetical protein